MRPNSTAPRGWWWGALRRKREAAAGAVRLGMFHWQCNLAWVYTLIWDFERSCPAFSCELGRPPTPRAATTVLWDPWPLTCCDAARSVVSYLNVVAVREPGSGQRAAAVRVELEEGVVTILDSPTMPWGPLVVSDWIVGTFESRRQPQPHWTRDPSQDQYGSTLVREIHCFICVDISSNILR